MNLDREFRIKRRFEKRVECKKRLFTLLLRLQTTGLYVTFCKYYETRLEGLRVNGENRGNGTGEKLPLHYKLGKDNYEVLITF